MLHSIDGAPHQQTPDPEAQGPELQDHAAAGTGPRRPRIGIMGEFSAGKSTLSNLLIGAPALPVKVTATQLPPVWLSYGDGPPVRVDLDGNEWPVDLENIAEVPVQSTLYIRVFARADVLELCDLIDFPGISDPNMPSEVWERVAPMADSVLWCTHATQAWRQSEAAVWEMMPPEMHETSFLLLTRMDKIVGERDRERVIRRVTAETGGLFANVFPVSLLQAVQAGDDAAMWEASGAEELMRALIDTLLSLSDRLGHPVQVAAPGHAADSEAPLAAPVTAPGMARVVATRTRPEPAPDEGLRVMPRRVTPRSGAARSRPPRDEARAAAPRG